MQPKHSQSGNLQWPTHSSVLCIVLHTLRSCWQDWWGSEGSVHQLPGCTCNTRHQGSRCEQGAHLASCLLQGSSLGGRLQELHTP